MCLLVCDLGAVAVQWQHKLKDHLKKKFHCVFEGIARAGEQRPLNEIYTEQIGRAHV